MNKEMLVELAKAVPENLCWSVNRALHKSIPVGKIARAFVALDSGMEYPPPEYEIANYEGVWHDPPKWERAHMMERARRARKRNKRRRRKLRPRNKLTRGRK
jgi:hypothetical protein